MGECGEISQVRFAEDRETGQFKGFGHIEFTDTQSTDEAVKMAGTEIMGRPVRVDYANSRRNSSAGGRGGGGRGGGGRGRGRRSFEGNNERSGGFSSKKKGG